MPVKKMFVSRVLNGDVNEINTFLAQNNIKVVETEKVSHEGAKYKSFKITISISDKNKILRRSFWPSGIRCKLWNEPVYDSDESDYDSENDPFNEQPNNNNDVDAGINSQNNIIS